MNSANTHVIPDKNLDPQMRTIPSADFSLVGPGAEDSGIPHWAQTHRNCKIAHLFVVLCHLVCGHLLYRNRKIMDT